MRQCGGCTLCCKLLPVVELEKRAGERCRFQRHGKGCTAYNRPPMPISCRLWNCRWLVGEAGDTGRPDRVHYVIDVLPDFVTMIEHDKGDATRTVPVVQVWIDPKYPDAHRDPALRAYLNEQGKRGIAALIRFDDRRALHLFPPSMTGGEWIERFGHSAEKTHSLAEIVEELHKLNTPAA